MSEMELHVVTRIGLGNGWTEESALEFCSRYIEPEDEGEFYFDVREDGFTFSLFEDRLYLDWYDLSVDSDYINIDFTLDYCEKVEKTVNNNFDDSLLNLISSVKYKVLYYYNGASAGAKEVE